MDDSNEVAAQRVGQVVDSRWTLQRLLGSGGMAAVYAARDARGAEAAVKLLHPEMGLKRDVRERFLRDRPTMTDPALPSADAQANCTWG